MIIVVGIVLGLAARYAIDALNPSPQPAAEAQAGEKMS